MVGVIILLMLIIILIGLTLVPVEFVIDSGKKVLVLRWIGIGKVIVVYEREEWWLCIRILFFQKNWRMLELLESTKKKEFKKRKLKVKIKKKRAVPFPKIIRIIRTFHITQWKLRLDTGDYSWNAWLFPINYFPFAYQKLKVNFQGDNYLLLIIRNTPLRVLRAWIR
jgi:hypothetical protein